MRQTPEEMASQQILSSANQAKATNFVCLGDYVSLLSDDTDGFVGSLASSTSYNGIRVEHNQGKSLNGIPDVQGECCLPILFHKYTAFLNLTKQSRITR